ncbi:MAG TPA: Clp protease N-terminal domain-containing protein [Streptosporangiaceae bacterium]
MFERFTTDARQAVHLALSEARVLRARRIGTEHLLLGLAHSRSGPAAEALRAAGLDAPTLRKLTVTRSGAAPLDADSLAVLGIDLDEVRRAAEAAFGPGALDRPARSSGSRTSRARMTPEAKEAISLGLRVAKSRHDYAVTAGHLLAGLIDQGDNEAVRVITAADVDPAVLRADVVNRLSKAA